MTTTFLPIQPQVEPQTEAVELDLAGMTCASCVQRIDKSLRAVQGVREADVNLVTQRATVTVEAGRASLAELTEAVERAGYEVTGSNVAPATPRAAPPSAPNSPQSITPDRAAKREQAEDQEHARLRRDVLVAAGLTIPVLILAMSHGAWAFAETTAGRWTQLLLATPVVFGPGARFLALAWKTARRFGADMNTLVSIGALASWTYSVVALALPGLFPHSEHGVLPHLYFEAAATIVTFVLLGKLLELRARRRLGDAVRGLHALVPSIARRFVAGRTVDIPVAALETGDVILVRPGERVPSDGIVIDGDSAVDESMLSGESLPVEKSAGDEVIGGSLNHSGALVIRIVRTGADTALARIAAAVESAQGSRAPIARLADRVSAYFVPIVLALATLTLGIWFAIEPTALGFSSALERAVAVLVIACPCALGLATPAAIAVGTGRAAELGILFKGGAVLEVAARIDTVFVDKTGTLTEGNPRLVDVITLGKFEMEQVLRFAAALELTSEHPLARAIVEGAHQRWLEVPSSSEFTSVAGAGVEGFVEGTRVRVGTDAWLAAGGVDSRPLEPRAAEFAARGRTPVFVAFDGELAGLLTLADRPAADARNAVMALRGRGMRVVMLTGDRRGTAEAIGRELGIHEIEADLLPQDKARIVSDERARGRRVAMVGDGVNDAPALAGADVGIAMGHGADIAAAAADVALLGGGIAALPRAFDLARATLRTIRRNLTWAFAYNVLGIPVAAGALYPWTGWSLSPMLASAAMSLSSVSVLLSSLALRRFARRSK